MFIYAILILFPALTFADDPYADLDIKLFNALDADTNGKITKTEFDNFFLGSDTSSDGVITLAEFQSGIDKLDPAVAGLLVLSSS